jgi:hypothetical protein
VRRKVRQPSTRGAASPEAARPFQPADEPRAIFLKDLTAISIVSVRWPCAAREVFRMAQSFGARMRDQRERQQISLIEISEQTKIKLSQLDALEHDDVSHWPTGIFRRAFIRAYATAIGLDADIVVREFLELYPDPAETSSPVPAIEPGTEGVDRAPMRVRFLIRSAMDSMSRKWVDLAGRRRLASEPAMLFDHALTPSEELPAPTIVAQAAVETVDVPEPLEPTPIVEMPRETARLRHDFTPEYVASHLLQRAAGELDAVGLIVWTWDAKEAGLVPMLAHGYSEQLLAQFSSVRRDADNATAAAFRSTQTCIVRSSDAASGAVVVPMMTPAGCVGVLAVELPRGAEQREPVRELAASVAAQFAELLGAPPLPHAVGV